MSDLGIMCLLVVGMTVVLVGIMIWKSTRKPRLIREEPLAKIETIQDNRSKARIALDAMDEAAKDPEAQAFFSNIGLFNSQNRFRNVTAAGSQSSPNLSGQ